MPGAVLQALISCTSSCPLTVTGVRTTVHDSVKTWPLLSVLVSLVVKVVDPAALASSRDAPIAVGLASALGARMRRKVASSTSIAVIEDDLDAMRGL